MGKQFAGIVNLMVIKRYPSRKAKRGALRETCFLRDIQLEDSIRRTEGEKGVASTRNELLHKSGGDEERR